MVEISNFRQLSRLNENEVIEIKDLLQSFSFNRGGRLVKDQNGYFLFCFHPKREKSLHLVSDFLFLSAESLQKKESSLFGFNLLLEESYEKDDFFIFNRLKSLLFLAPTENSVWAGSQIKAKLQGLFPLEGKENLSEIIGPVYKSVFEPLSFSELMELSGWSESLKSLLERQLADTSRQGRIARLRGENCVEKLLILHHSLRSLLGNILDSLVIFPLVGSQDFLSQLLYHVNQDFVSQLPEYLTKEECLKWQQQPQWDLILRSQGGTTYSGDSCEIDMISALTFYYLTFIRRVKSHNLPPIFIFLLSDYYENKAAQILQSIITHLVTSENLLVLVLEPLDQKKEFLSEISSISWTFPPLYLTRISREIRKRGWEKRFPFLDENLITICQGQASRLAHILWGVQESRMTFPLALELDVSWELLMRLDFSHHKVLYAFLLGQALMSEIDLVSFFHFLGEDQAIIQDKLQNLKALRFILFDNRNLSLAWNWRQRLKDVLGQDGQDIHSRLSDFLYQRWTVEKKFSEVIFFLLKESGKTLKAMKVLHHYINQKIDRKQNDFFFLLRPSLWEDCSQEHHAGFIQLSAALKLRFALNWKDSRRNKVDLNRIKKYFNAKTELKLQGEWCLQLGRYHLYHNDFTLGFQLLKKSLMTAQEENDCLLEIRANIEIGKALLMKHRLDEGQGYFEIASRLSEKVHSLYHFIVARGWESICCFLYGNLNQVMKHLESLIPLAQRLGLQEWKAFFYFLKARVTIEWGDFAQAVSFLETSYETACVYGFSSITFLLWKGRGLYGSGKEQAAIKLVNSLPPGLERNFFLAELKVFTKEYQEALCLLEKGLEFTENTMPSKETLLWDNGFSNIEDTVLEKSGNKGVLRQQTEALQLYVRSRLAFCDQIEKEFQNLLCEKSLLEINPFSHYVYLWYFLSLPKDKPEREALRLTLLGRALKDLQSRGSRIEDYQLRQNFLFKSYWNKLLMDEAKKHKLL